MCERDAIGEREFLPIVEVEAPEIQQRGMFGTDVKIGMNYAGCQDRRGWVEWVGWRGGGGGKGHLLQLL